MLCLEHVLSGSATNLELPIEQIAMTVKKRGLILLISDLLAPTDSLERYLGYLRSRGHEVVLLRVLDPAERDFPFQDAALIEDLETGRDLYVDPTTTRGEYRQRFEEHARSISRACSNLGIDFYEITTDQPLELALFDLMHARMRRGRKITRTGAPRHMAGRGGAA